MSDETKPTTEAPAAEVSVDKKIDDEAQKSGEDAVMSGALDADNKTNGDKPTEAPATEDKAADAMEVDQPAEKAEETNTAEESVAPVTDADATPATPASTKKANGKRKSISGVPEHKTKKLNKKKSMPKLTNLDAQPGDYFLARFKGYAPWPSIICDEEMLPIQLLNTRPVTTKQVDGKYKEAYEDGGKKVNERTFPIMFLHTNEFAWIPNTDLTPVAPEDCIDVVEKGKSKQLIEAYKVASEGHDIEHFKSLLREHERALQEDADAKEEAARAKAEKAEKKSKRKSVDASQVDIDMEDAGSADDGVKSSSKKRKKNAESDAEAPEKAAKTPKTNKLKLTGPKTPASEKKAAATPKDKKPRSTKKAKADSEDVIAPAKVEKPIDPAEAKAKREKEILYLRHRLQKGFLSRDQAPKASEMEQMSHHLDRLEEQTDLEVSIIRTTKINKVLKAINKLPAIPRDEEYKIRSRSIALLSTWNKLLGAGEKEKDPKATPATNGVHKDDKTDSAAEDEGAANKKEDSAAPAADDEKTSTEPAKAEATTEKEEKTTEDDKKDEAEEPKKEEEVETKPAEDEEEEAEIKPEEPAAKDDAEEEEKDE